MRAAPLSSATLLGGLCEKASKDDMGAPHPTDGLWDFFVYQQEVLKTAFQHQGEAYAATG